MSLSLLIADDHHIIRHGLKDMFKSEPDFRVMAEANSGIETLRLVEKYKPDVLVLDLMMPSLSGVEVLEQLGQRSPRTRVVVLSIHDNVAYVARALRLGATCYVRKDATAGQLVHAIREAAAGRRYLSPGISEAAVAAYETHATDQVLDPYNTLTSREREVLGLAAEGLSSSEIAKRLFISPRTVESHRANLMRKLDLRNQTELVRYVLNRRPPQDTPAPC